jgi:hypothetical protein
MTPHFSVSRRGPVARVGFRGSVLVLCTLLSARALAAGDPPARADGRSAAAVRSAVLPSADHQGVLDVAVVNRHPSAMLLFDVKIEAALNLTLLSVPVVSTGAAPTPTAPYIVAMHDALQPGLPPLAVGDRVAFVGKRGLVPSRTVRGVVVARRHYMFTRTRERRTQADGVWEYGWAYLVQVPMRDRNPNSRYAGWLEGFTVTRDPSAPTPD